MNLFNQNPASRQLKIDTALEFLFAGKAIFTVKSTKTGKHFTYKVSEPKTPKGNKQVHFISLLTGSDNESDYQYFATIFDKKAYMHGRRSRIGADAPGVVAFKYTLEHLLQGDLDTRVQIFHEGRCCKCGRKLTHPESIESGIGPECSKMTR